MLRPRPAREESSYARHCSSPARVRIPVDLAAASGRGWSGPVSSTTTRCRPDSRTASSTSSVVRARRGNASCGVAQIGNVPRRENRLQHRGCRPHTTGARHRTVRRRPGMSVVFGVPRCSARGCRMHITDGNRTGASPSRRLHARQASPRVRRCVPERFQSRHSPA